MNKRILCASTALALLAGGASMLAQSTPLFAAAANASSKPQLGNFGVDLAGMDRAVKPGDDFFKYVNGTWVARTEIPADKASWGGFNILRDLSDKRTREIIELVSKGSNAQGSAAQKVGDMFASFMDDESIEKLGYAPVKPMLDRIAGLDTPSALARFLGSANRLQVNVPIGIGIEQDLKNNQTYSAYLGQGGLGLPDRDYYLVDSNPKFVEARAKYKTHIANILKLGGFDNADARAQGIYDLEAQIAKSHWTKAESRQIDKLYNPVAVADLGTKMPGFDWAGFLSTSGLDSQTQVIATQPSALTAAAKLMTDVPLQTWKDYLSLRILDDAAPYLSKAFVDENFDFQGKTLSGTPQIKDRWKRGVDVVNGSLGEAVGQIYVQRYFPPAAKAKADELVRNIIKAMDIRLSKLAWMDPATKTKAREKLAAFTPKIGYPTKWRDYSKLEIRKGDAFGNIIRATEFEYNRNLAKIGKPVDRTEWGMTPQTVNAYANPLMNEIVFPAAILQPPFFDPNADPAVNYGGIGAVIGHEISHHFDDQGRKFDKTGNLADWWTKDDVTRFTAMTDKVVKQYAAYEPLPGTHVNGELTLGENMADLAGVTVAYDAYRISLGNKPAKPIGGFSGDQRFFLGFGQIWQTKYRDATLLRQLTTDPHTAGHYRPYVARNLDAWYAAFSVQPGEKFYLKPEDRIKVW